MHLFQSWKFRPPLSLENGHRIFLKNACILLLLFHTWFLLRIYLCHLITIPYRYWAFLPYVMWHDFEMSYFNSLWLFAHRLRKKGGGSFRMKNATGFFSLKNSANVRFYLHHIQMYLLNSFHRFLTFMMYQVMRPGSNNLNIVVHMSSWLIFYFHYILLNSSHLWRFLHVFDSWHNISHFLFSLHLHFLSNLHSLRLLFYQLFVFASLWNCVLLLFRILVWSTP